MSSLQIGDIVPMKIRPASLFQLINDAAYKINLRSKRPPNPLKWPPDGVDEEGNRDWNRVRINFLIQKLDEEYVEMRQAVEELLVGDSLINKYNLRMELADVVAVTMMIADRLGVHQSLPKMPNIVCLCGSTRFHSEFVSENARLTGEGNIVLSVGFFMHHDHRMNQLESALRIIENSKFSSSQDLRNIASEVLQRPEQRHGQGVGITEEQKKSLDDLHKRKIDLCNEVFVINVGGYIGHSTRSEIEYAESIGRRVRYLENIHVPV